MKNFISGNFLTRMCRLSHSRAIRWPYYLAFVSSTLILFYFTRLHLAETSSQQIYDASVFQQHPSEKPHFSSPSAEKRVKRILFWTTYFDWKDFEFGMGQEPFVRAGCRVTNCMTTNDRRFLNDSDALLFHPINYDPVNDVPPHRNPRQRYVFLFYEAETSGRIYPVFQHSATHKGFFNWTMTYRRDSDVHSSEPYGILRRRKNMTSSSIYNLDTLPIKLAPGKLPPNSSIFLENIMMNNNESTNNSFVKKKSKKIAWFLSKCWTQSRRENFFRRLFDFYPSIDVYGECGSKGLDCLPWKSLECDQLIADYKFYVAAENSLCPDYVTEKFYRALQVGTVPIVYGGADYSAYAPPYSFIHAADFRSPKALADYLILLDENPNLYARYFEWNKDWMVDRQPFDGWCDLCEKLNNDPEVSKSYEDIGKWWFDDAPCLPRSSVKNQSSQN